MVRAQAYAQHLRADCHQEDRAVLRRFVERVELGRDAVAIRLDTKALLDWIHPGLAETIGSDPAALVLTIPVKLRRRGAELKLVLTDRQQPIRRDRSLINALARGFGWFEELRTGAAPSRENVSPNLVRRLHRSGTPANRPCRSHCCRPAAHRAHLRDPQAGLSAAGQMARADPGSRPRTPAAHVRCLTQFSAKTCSTS